MGLIHPVQLKYKDVYTEVTRSPHVNKCHLAMENAIASLKSH